MFDTTWPFNFRIIPSLLRMGFCKVQTPYRTLRLTARVQAKFNPGFCGAPVELSDVDAFLVFLYERVPKKGYACLIGAASL